MKVDDAVAICEEWFAYLDRQRAKSVEIQRLAAMARNGQQEEAQRRLRQIDNTPTVYDGGRLEPAVKELVRQARKIKRAPSARGESDG